MDPRELLDVLHKRIAMFIAAREAREDKYGRTGISAESLY
jgi:hypothetical protein